MNPTDLPLMHQVCLHLPPASLFLIHSCLVHKTVCNGVRKKHFLCKDLGGVEESSSRTGLFRHWQKLHRSIFYVSRQSKSIQVNNTILVSTLCRQSFRKLSLFSHGYDVSDTIWPSNGMQNEVEIILCRHQVVDPDLFHVSSTLCFLVMWSYTVRLTSANAGQLKAKHPRSTKFKVNDNEAKSKQGVADYFDEWPSKNQTPCYSQTMRFRSQCPVVSHFVNCRFFPTGMTCGDTHESWNAE
ncbi:unnamed protein product [Clavelina lepadiformis]|uniref:Uncharacterized protein n=1 Tax=Clavelina lepadiformis TaxID=159417 RepID=A0ABP0GEI8_CLALP